MAECAWYRQWNLTFWQAACSGLVIILKYRTPPPTLRAEDPITGVLCTFDIFKWSHNKQILLAVCVVFDWDFDLIWFDIQLRKNESKRLYEAGWSRKTVLGWPFYLGSTLYARAALATPHKMSGRIFLVHLHSGYHSHFLGNKQRLKETSSWLRAFQKYNYGY